MDILVIAGGILALFCLIMAFRSFSRKRVIDDTPTSKTRGVFIGLSEVKGGAETETPLISYLAEIECVQYAWQIQEHWSRTVATKNGTRTQTGWDTVESGGQSSPFYLKDDTGVLRILPEGASIEGITTFDETCSRNDPLYFGRGPAEEIANSTHRRRFRETALPLHVMLYVMGQARERQDAVAAEIASSKTTPVFLISTHTEKQVSARFGYRFWLWLTGGLISSLGTVFFRGTETSGGLGWPPYLIAAGGFLFASAAVWVWMVYNSFINLHHRAGQAWSQVEVQLKRRNDLIPNLVQIVEGYRDHEKETQTILAEMRSQMLSTPPGIAGPDFKGITSTLRATIERYPELKASESFLRLQEALVDTEQRIALARDYFNEVAMNYNTRLEIIPDRMVGALARLHPRPLMGAADFERAPVQIKPA